jgi:hypothetical protein
MAELFLDEKTPLSTCTAGSCEECKISGKLACHFNMRQLAFFLSTSLPIFLLAGILIYRFNPFVLIPWALFTVSYFGFIEIRVMCSHCPHYAEPGLASLKCWANYGSPKLWKYRPGPMTVMEKVIFFGGFIIILSVPICFAILTKNFVLLFLLLAATCSWKVFLGLFYCKKCINFACPMNTVDTSTRNEFFLKNPVVKNAWIS